MNYLLDTNILLHYLRRDYTSTFIDRHFDPLRSGTYPMISVVTQGELRSLARQFNWGKTRQLQLELLLEQLLVADIHVDEIIERYAEIDAFSQGKLAGQPLPISARNMGKNDLWIAATASVAGYTLLTTDQDFDHLDGTFLQVNKIVVQTSSTTTE